MAKQLQLRRGTTLQNDAFIGAVGEPTLDTETGMIHIHDGVTQGGMEFIDAVVAFQKPTVENGYTWYRKYASGWVEQGGIATTNGGNPTPVSLVVEMADANYIPFIQGRTQADGHGNAGWQVMPVGTATSPTTTTQFYAQGSITGYNLGFAWRVEGMAA